jgi:hypothetical protein
MATLTAVDTTRALLSYQVVNDRDSLISLLKRNGVSLSPNSTDAELNTAILVASSKSENFKKELARLLASKAQSAGDKFASFAGGEDMFGFTGIDDFQSVNGPALPRTTVANVKAQPVQISASRMASIQAQAVNPTGAKGKTKVGAALSSVGKFLKDNVLTKENIDTAVQVGLTKINTSTQNKANKVANETLLLQQQQDEIRIQQGAGAKTGMGTGAWIAIGIGAVALVGIIIYVSTRGGKKAGN